MKIIDPSRNTVIAEVKDDSAASIRAKYAKARAAQPAWAETAMKQRLDAITAFRDTIVRRQPELAATLTSEMGKPIKQSRNELNGLVGRIDFFLAEAARTLRDEKVFADRRKSSRAHLARAAGVIANISAELSGLRRRQRFIPALLAGNEKRYKPSEFATTGLAIAEMLVAAVFDDVHPVVGGGAAGRRCSTNRSTACSSPARTPPARASAPRPDAG
jgi:acyl-CoA reductase-like NAD-dependent aldehyde dehydrogenase